MKIPIISLVGCLLLGACNENTSTNSISNSNSQTTVVESNNIKEQTVSNYPAEIIGTFIGRQDAYYLKNKNGEDLIINGNKVPVPSYDASFTLLNDGTVEFVQVGSGMHVVYNGIFQVIENTTSNIQVKCEVSTNDKTSNPSYVLNFDKTTNEITCVGGSNEPLFLLNRKEGSADTNSQNQGRDNDEVNNYSNQSSDGIYTYSDNSVTMRIAIKGNIWRGKTMIISGFGAENDNQNAQYDNGVVNGNSLFDASGYVEIGHINGRYLTTTIADHSVTLSKQ